MNEQCKITEFPSPSHLSDDDIINLVMGVVRLLKNHATDEQVQRVLTLIEEADLL